MFRSSLYFSREGFDAEGVLKWLRDKLPAGLRRISMAAGALRNQPGRYLSIDLCRAEASAHHLRKVRERLEILLPICDENGEIRKCLTGRRSLVSTVTNGHADANFVRRLILTPDLMRICEKHSIEIVLDVCPCGG